MGLPDIWQKNLSFQIKICHLSLLVLIQRFTARLSSENPEREHYRVPTGSIWKFTVHYESLLFMMEAHSAKHRYLISIRHWEIKAQDLPQLTETDYLAKSHSCKSKYVFPKAERFRSKDAQLVWNISKWLSLTKSCKRAAPGLSDRGPLFV